MVTSIKAPLEGATTILHANQFPIKSVKLVGSSRAEITRTFSLSFLHSQDEPQVLEIVHLPASLQSVDVSLTPSSGNVTILDHYHVSQPHVTSSSQTLLELRAEEQRLEDEKRLRQQSFTFLTTYMDSLAQCKSHGKPEAAQMVSFFDDFVEIGIARSTIIADLDGKLAGVDNRITEETQRLSKLNTDLPIKIVVVLSCNGEVPGDAAQLTVTYVVNQVSWKPEYDLHIEMKENTPSPAVRLDFRCSVTQWTGENWENVNLALTTADHVSKLIQLPEPKRIDISLSPMGNSTPASERGQPPQAPPHNFRPFWSDQATPQNHPSLFRGTQQLDGYDSLAFGRFSESEQLERDRECKPSARSVSRKLSAVHPVQHRTALNDTHSGDVQSQIVSQLIAHGNKDPITHIASGCIFIPTDRAGHHILVTSIPLLAEFTHVSAPSVDSRVYYMCEVKNTSDYVLLPGTVKAYLNNKQVSSTEIHNTELPQILECPLAVDTGIKTIHNHTPDTLPSANVFTGKATTTYTDATIIQNTHAEVVRGVIVRSAIPLPTDPRITIVLKEPRGLAEIDEGSVSIREGCLARWSTTGGRKGKQVGLFEWVCDVNPGTEVLKVVWEVCAPQDLKLLEQIRS